MVTTFDVARWAVRTILFVQLGAVAFELFRHISALYFSGYSKALPSLLGSGLFLAAPSVIVIAALFFFSDALAKEINGGWQHTQEPLQSLFQIRLLTPALIGFVLITVALPISLRSSWLFAQQAVPFYFVHSRLPNFEDRTIYTLVVPFCISILQCVFGIILLCWRRLAQLFARPV